MFTDQYRIRISVFLPHIYTALSESANSDKRTTLSTSNVDNIVNTRNLDGWLRTSRMVRVCDIIWMLTCDWLVGKLSLERDRTNCLDPLSIERLFSSISVLINTLEIYVELWTTKCAHVCIEMSVFTFVHVSPHLRALMLNAVRSNLLGETGKFRQNIGSALPMSFFGPSLLPAAASAPSPLPLTLFSADVAAVDVLPLLAALFGLLPDASIADDLLAPEALPVVVVVELPPAFLLNSIRMASAMR